MNDIESNADAEVVVVVDAEVAVEALPPNVGKGAEDFFQSDRDLEIQRRQELKRQTLGSAGSPVTVSSKVLALLFPRLQPQRASASDAGEAAPLVVYVAESGHIARRLNLNNGKTSVMYRGHTGPVTSLDLSYDSNSIEEFLFTGSWDKTIKKWAAKTGECLLTLSGHSDFVKCLLVVPGVQPTLYSGSSDSTIRIWNAATGAQLSMWKGHKRPVEALIVDEEIGDDGEAVGVSIFSASSDNTIGRWDVKSGTIKATLAGHQTSVYGLLAADGDLWSVSADNTARRWNLGTLKQDTVLDHPDFVKCVAVVGAHVVTGGRDEVIRVWNAATGKCIRLIEGHFGEVSSLAVYGGKLWSGSLDGTIRRWELSEILNPTRVEEAAGDIDVGTASSAAEKDKGECMLTEEEERELAELMDD